MAASPVLDLVATAKLMEINRRTTEDQKWLLCTYDGGKIMNLLAKPPLVRRGARGAEVYEGERAKVKKKY